MSLSCPKIITQLVNVETWLDIREETYFLWLLDLLFDTCKGQRELPVKIIIKLWTWSFVKGNFITEAALSLSQTHTRARARAHTQTGPRVPPFSEGLCLWKGHFKGTNWNVWRSLVDLLRSAEGYVLRSGPAFGLIFMNDFMLWAKETKDNHSTSNLATKEIRKRCKKKWRSRPERCHRALHSYRPGFVGKWEKDERGKLHRVVLLFWNSFVGYCKRIKLTFIKYY